MFFSLFLLETPSCILKVYTCMHGARRMAMNPRPNMIWIKNQKEQGEGIIQFTWPHFQVFSFVTLASTGVMVQLYVIWGFKYKFNLFKYQISANRTRM